MMQNIQYYIFRYKLTSYNFIKSSSILQQKLIESTIMETKALEATIRLRIRTNKDLDFMLAIQSNKTIQQLAKRILICYVQLIQSKQFSKKNNNKMKMRDLTVSSIKLDGYYITKHEVIKTILNDYDEIECTITKAKPKYPNQPKIYAQTLQNINKQDIWGRAHSDEYEIAQHRKKQSEKLSNKRKQKKNKKKKQKMLRKDKQRNQNIKIDQLEQRQQETQKINNGGKILAHLTQKVKQIQQKNIKQAQQVQSGEYIRNTPKFNINQSCGQINKIQIASQMKKSEEQADNKNEQINQQQIRSENRDKQNDQNKNIQISDKQINIENSNQKQMTKKDKKRKKKEKERRKQVTVQSQQIITNNITNKQVIKVQSHKKQNQIQKYTSSSQKPNKSLSSPKVIFHNSPVFSPKGFSNSPIRKLSNSGLNDKIQELKLEGNNNKDKKQNNTQANLKKEIEHVTQKIKDLQEETAPKIIIEQDSDVQSPEIIIKNTSNKYIIKTITQQQQVIVQQDKKPNCSNNNNSYHSRIADLQAKVSKYKLDLEDSQQE